MEPEKVLSTKTTKTSSGILSRQFVWNVIKYTVLILFLIFVVILIGAEAEAMRIRRATGTIHFYSQSDVCAFHYPTSQIGARLNNEGMEDLSVKSFNFTFNRINQNITYSSAESKSYVSQSASLEKSGHVQSGTSNSSQKLVVEKSPIEFLSYPSKLEVQAIEEVENEDIVVAHCGECGACSNPHDINVYDLTKKTLFGTTKSCAKKGFLLGRDKAEQCMTENAGLTKDCTDCWVDNIMCDLRQCIFTCLKYNLLHPNAQKGQKGLDPCTECDEKMCGPAFITCAGANRRRSGIHSDITRDETTEVCSRNDPLWWKDAKLQAYYKETSSQESVKGIIV